MFAIKHKINDKCLIFSDVIPENIIDHCILLIHEYIKNNNYYLRFDFVDEHGQKFHIYEHYNKIDTYLKNIFEHKIPKEDEQKVLQIGSNEIPEAKKLIPYCESLVKLIYPNKKFFSNTHDFFYCGPNSFMNHHSDSGPNRLCTSILYLNDKNENNIGGNLLFYNNKKEVIYEYQPKKGDIIVLDDINHSVSKIENWYRLTHRIYWNEIS